MNIALLAQGLLSMIKVLPIWFDVLWTRTCHIAKCLVVSTYILFKQRKGYHFSTVWQWCTLHTCSYFHNTWWISHIYIPLGADAALLFVGCVFWYTPACLLLITMTSLWRALTSSETRSMLVIDDVWCAHSPLGGLLERFFGIAPVATEIKKGLISWAQQ